MDQTARMLPPAVLKICTQRPSCLSLKILERNLPKEVPTPALCTGLAQGSCLVGPTRLPPVTTTEWWGPVARMQQAPANHVSIRVVSPTFKMLQYYQHPLEKVTLWMQGHSPPWNITTASAPSKQISYTKRKQDADWSTSPSGEKLNAEMPPAVADVLFDASKAGWPGGPLASSTLSFVALQHKSRPRQKCQISYNTHNSKHHTKVHQDKKRGFIPKKHTIRTSPA